MRVESYRLPCLNHFLRFLATGLKVLPGNGVVTWDAVDRNVDLILEMYLTKTEDSSSPPLHFSETVYRSSPKMRHKTRKGEMR